MNPEDNAIIRKAITDTLTELEWGTLPKKRIFWYLESRVEYQGKLLDAKERHRLKNELHFRIAQGIPSFAKQRALVAVVTLKTFFLNRTRKDIITLLRRALEAIDAETPNPASQYSPAEFVFGAAKPLQEKLPLATRITDTTSLDLNGMWPEKTTIAKDRKETG